MTGVATDTCPATPGPFVEVGPTVQDFTKALSDQVGPVRRSGPNYIKLGGFPAERFNLTYDFSYPCPAGPEGREVWIDRDGSQFTQFKDGTGTVYVVDVDGDRVVMTTHYRGASAADIAELDAIVASMQIRPMAAELPGGGFLCRSWTVSRSPSARRRRPGMTGAGSATSPSTTPSPVHRVPRRWSTGPPSRMEVTPPRVATSRTCPPMHRRPILPSRYRRRPASSSSAGPEDVTVGGRPAKHLVVRVREDLGCDPGYFFTWHDR